MHMKKIITILILAMSLGLGGCFYDSSKVVNEPLKNYEAPVVLEKETPSISEKIASTSSVVASSTSPKVFTIIGDIATSSPEWTKNGRPSIDILKGMKIGKIISGMTVTSYIFEDYKRVVAFSGKVRLSGDFKKGMGEEDCDGAWFKNLDATSEEKMPKFSPSDKSFFCLNDSSELQKNLLSKSDSGRATIEIDNFNLVYCECGAWSNADLIKVISVEKK